MKIALTGKLGAGKFALVDDEDYEYLNRWKWNMSIKGYAVRTDGMRHKGQRIKWGLPMHKVVASRAGIVGKQIDHKNTDRLDNQRNNLRPCNQSQNNANSRLRSDNTSGYKGVSWHKDARKWHAYITFNKQREYFGFFTSKEEAAAAYNQAAMKYYGEFARLNKIKNPPPAEAGGGQCAA